MLGEIKSFSMPQNNETKTTSDTYIIACLSQYSSQSQNGNNEITLFEEKGFEVKKQGKSSNHEKTDFG